jgi:hypothetical protein
VVVDTVIDRLLLPRDKVIAGVPEAAVVVVVRILVQSVDARDVIAYFAVTVSA